MSAAYDVSRLHHHHVEASTEPSTGPGDDRRRTLALVVLCLCALTTAVDITITNVALPFISSELSASTSDLQWVIDSYNIVLVGLLVLGGGLADRYGRKRVFLIGYGLFGLACLLAAFSPSTGALIGARALMGIGAALVIAPALAIIAGLYPPARRAGAIALWAVFGAIGIAIGPVVGGLLLDRYWWGSVFLVNVPLVAIGVVIGLRVIPESRKPTQGSLDLLGAVLSVVGLGAVLFGVIEGPERGWAAPEVVASVLVGLVALGGFVTHELRTASPLFDVRILTRPIVAAASLALFVTYIVFTGMLFLLPQYLQDVRAESIIAVGLLLLPFAVVFGLASMRSGPVLRRLGPRTTVSSGLVISALGAGLLALALDDALWLTIVATLIVAIGMSLLIAPASTVMMNDLPPEQAGDGSSLSMVSRFAGAAFGVAVVGSVFASIYSSQLAGDIGDVPGLGPTQADTAEASIQGALDTAARLSGPARNQLTDLARDAFTAGARAGYLVIAAIAALGAVWAWRALRGAASR